MKNETIHAVLPEDGHSFDDFELIDALTVAADLATASDDNAMHYVHLEDGRMISGLRVEVETLTDGSKVATIYLKTN